MAIAVQQIHPVAHLPSVLGVLRRLEVATVIDRLIPSLTRRMASRVGVGSKPWYSPCWMGIMLSTKWATGGITIPASTCLRPKPLDEQ
jgi:hypothetical protein